MPFRLVSVRMIPAVLSIGLAAPLWAEADQIYRGGPILTMNDTAPNAQAVAVEDGRILAVGPMDSVMQHKGEGTEMIDLAGRAMLPGFVDSHGHVVMGGLQALSANLLAPPDGEVTDIASLQATLTAWLEANRAIVEQVGLIVGFGYDESQLAEKRPPNRYELDAVSTDYPIILVHQSAHFGVANSRALQVAGIGKGSVPPPGGIIRFDEAGEPTGVLEENAFFAVLVPFLGGLGEEGMKAFARAGTALWARYGYTTAQEGRSSSAVVAALRAVAAESPLPVDVVAYPDVLVEREFVGAQTSLTYENGVRVGGAKLTIDGSPQGFTALRDRPYYNPVGDYPPGWAGYASASPEQILDTAMWCYENGIQLLTHANGEGASDQLIAALRAAQDTYGPKPIRPVLIHGQFLRADQVDAYQALGVFPSLFPMHTFYWGDWHRDHTVGPVRADNISPTGWLRQRGMIFGTHHDAPVAFPDSMRVLSATVTRRTRSGDILGPDQRVDVMTALKAMTIWPAWQHFEEDSKGSIEPGKRADFVILSDDPRVVDPKALAQLSVQVTIKDGRVVYEAPEGGVQKTDLRHSPFASDPVVAHRFLDAMALALHRL